jgi:hypothetical protein
MSTLLIESPHTPSLIPCASQSTPYGNLTDKVLVQYKFNPLLPYLRPSFSSRYSLLFTTISIKHKIWLLRLLRKWQCQPPRWRLLPSLRSTFMVQRKKLPWRLSVMDLWSIEVWCLNLGSSLNNPLLTRRVLVWSFCQGQVWSPTSVTLARICLPVCNVHLKWKPHLVFLYLLPTASITTWPPS